MKRLSDVAYQGDGRTKDLNLLKRRLEALLGVRLYAAILRRYLWAVNHDMVERVRRNRVLEGTARGRCFVLGNGPSLKGQDLRILQGEDVFTCNYYCDIERLGGTIPVAHFITDERLLEGGSPPILKVLAQCQEQGVTRLFLGADSYESAQRHNLEEQFDVFYLMQGAPMVNGVKYGLDGILPSFETVIHSEILAAVYMGYSEIFLLGCDCTGFATFAQTYQVEAMPVVSSGYGISLTKEAERSIEKILTRRPIEEELRAYAGLFDSYEQLLGYCSAHKVQLLNATKGGVLRSIPRTTLSFLE